MNRLISILTGLLLVVNTSGQTARDLISQVRNNLEKVNDYQATGKLKTNVVFIKAPVASVRIYYKKPDKLKIVNETGISFIPKGAININLNSFLGNIENVEVIDAGTEATTGFRILKLLPADEKSDIVLSTLYIDEKLRVIRKAKNTTRDSGTYELELSYGAQASYGLPDKVIFSFNTKEYKLPKGVTFDYDTGTKNNTPNNLKNQKGKIEITYSKYLINKGLNDSVFD